MPSLREDLCAVLLLGISALALLGCGGGTRRPRRPHGARRRPGNRAATTAAANASRLSAWGPSCTTLDTLESRLAAGLSYEQYFAEVQRRPVRLRDGPGGRARTPLPERVGTPAEKALDQYIEAANVWRECRADVSCGTYTIEPRLQRKWRVASHYIAARPRRLTPEPARSPRKLGGRLFDLFQGG